MSIILMLGIFLVIAGAVKLCAALAIRAHQKKGEK